MTAVWFALPVQRSAPAPLPAAGGVTGSSRWDVRVPGYTDSAPQAPPRHAEVEHQLSEDPPRELWGSYDREQWIAAGYCPDSGERLVLAGSVLMCDACDCWGIAVMPATS